MKSIWLTWERQTRNESMAHLLSAEYCELLSSHKGLLRYAQLSWKTLILIFRKRPNIIFFQNPSIVLSLICTFIKIMRRKKIIAIADFHNCALDKNNFHKLNVFICKTADITLVTNNNLSNIIKRMGGKPFVFPDPIPRPDINQEEQINPENKFIVFISSWAEDEPINEVCTAFIGSDLNNQGVKLIVTGRIKAGRLNNSVESYTAKNITFTGFVSEENYWSLLKNSLFNIDLTTREDCMVCGAYESLAVKNTILLSNNAPTINYFRDAAIYTNNTPMDLKEKIKFLYDNHLKFKIQAEYAFIQLKNQEQKNLREINKLIKKS